MTGSGAAAPAKAREAATTDDGVTEDLDAAVHRILREKNGLFHLHVVDFMAAHLADCCAVFSDLHEMQVFTVVAQRYLRDRVSHENGGAPERRAVSASRIAAQTGMSRETVRRKLAALEARGWIEKTERATWRMTISNGHVDVASSLEDFTKREIRRIVRLGRAIRPLI